MEQRRFRKLLAVILLAIALLAISVIGLIPDESSANLDQHQCAHVQGHCIDYEYLMRTIGIPQLFMNI
jgi:hypothetical protein